MILSALGLQILERPGQLPSKSSRIDVKLSYGRRKGWFFVVPGLWALVREMPSFCRSRGQVAGMERRYGGRCDSSLRDR